MLDHPCLVLVCQSKGEGTVELVPVAESNVDASYPNISYIWKIKYFIVIQMQQSNKSIVILNVNIVKFYYIDKIVYFIDDEGFTMN